jgi:hypothetical protein
MKPQELFDALERGEKVEYKVGLYEWERWTGTAWNQDKIYRIAPKKEMTLVDQLRITNIEICKDAADRIEELEALYASSISAFTTDELLAEIKRRMT